MPHSTYDHRQGSRGADKAPAVEARDRAMQAPHWPASFAAGGAPWARYGHSSKHDRGVGNCPGCKDSPWPECACCGTDAIVTLRDDDFPHSIPLCRSCLRVLLAARRESREERELAEARAAAKAGAPQQAQLPLCRCEEPETYGAPASPTASPAATVTAAATLRAVAPRRRDRAAGPAGREGAA